MRVAPGILLLSAIAAAASGGQRGAPAFTYRFLVGERWVRDAPAGLDPRINHNLSFIVGAEVAVGRWFAGYSFLHNPGFGYPRHPAAVEEHEFFSGLSLTEGSRFTWRLRPGAIIARANFTERGVEPLPTFGKSSLFVRPSVAGEAVWRAGRRVNFEGRLRYRRRVKPANWSYAPSSFGLSCDSWESMAPVRYTPWPIVSADVAAAVVRDGLARGFGSGYAGETYPPATEFHVYAGGTFYLGVWGAR